MRRVQNWAAAQIRFTGLIFLMAVSSLLQGSVAWPTRLSQEEEVGVKCR